MAAGTEFVRVYRREHGPDAFNPSVQDDPPLGSIVTGGRFDAITARGGPSTPPYLYAGLTIETALAETYVRDLDYAAIGLRPLPWARVEGRNAVRLRSLRPLQFVDVAGAGAQQVGQDDWLTHCDESGYPTCRRWAAAVRSWVPTADGLRWASKRENGDAFVIWQAGTPTFEVLADDPIDFGGGRLLLEEFLYRWRLYLDNGA